MRRISLVCLLLLPLLVQAAPTVPPEKELRTLARDSLLQFNQAVQAKDFAAFYKQISEVWQKQITPDKLKEAFQTFIDQKLDIAGVAQAEPKFDPAPKIDGDGVLILEGTYPTTPSTVLFRLKYVQEKSAWKLLGVKLNVQPAEGAKPTEGKLPTEKECKRLVRDSLMGFNTAVQATDFSSFYKQIAAVWQKQTSPERLQKLFQSFIEQDIDISGIAREQPSFDQEPEVDADGLLQLAGHYDLDPENVLFKLAYIFEAPEWKLVKINVKVGEPNDVKSDE